MKMFFPAAMILLFVCCLSAQIQDVKTYRGEDYLPYIFEPYSADYSVERKVFVNTTSFMPMNSIVQITELEKEWEEISRHYTTLLGNEIEIGNTLTQIDLKTGLPKKFVYSLIYEDSLTTIETNFLDGKIAVRQRKIDNKGNVKAEKLFTFDEKEKLYPCYSTAMSSFLPYKENFSAAFNCFAPDLFGNKKLKPVLWTAKMTVRLVDSETISNRAGVFDCFKIEKNIVKTGYYDEAGIFRQTDEIKKGKDGGKERFSFVETGIEWIDKKTRKLIKFESSDKPLSQIIEIQPATRKL